MLTVANDSMQRSRSRRRTREATRKVFLLGMLGGVCGGAMLFFSGPEEMNTTPDSPKVATAQSAQLPVVVASSLKGTSENSLTAQPEKHEAIQVNETEVAVLKNELVPVVPETKTAPELVGPQPLAAKLPLPKPAVAKSAPLVGERVKQMVANTPTDSPELAPKPVAKPKPQSYPGVDQVLGRKMFTLFDDYDVPEAGVAVVDIRTGEVMSALGYKDGKLSNQLAKEARWPAASVFKIVTASALMGKGLHSKSDICFNGGFRPITANDLRGKTGNTCASMKTSFSRSYNVPFARWSNAFLTRDELTREAHAFGFQRSSALGLPKSAHGKLEIPLDKLKRAGAAAGFGEIYLSPLHGALMAAAVGNGGAIRKPVWEAGQATQEVRVFPSSRARALKDMMVATVSSGTARRTFKEQGKPAMGKHGAGGKTGTLGHRGRDLSWFVGFAPADKPRYAVGAYIANRPTWRIRASYVGREALRSVLMKTTPYRPKKSSLASR